MGKKKLGITFPDLEATLRDWILNTGKPSEILYALAQSMVDIAEEFQIQNQSKQAQTWRSLAKKVGRTGNEIQRGIA